MKTFVSFDFENDRQYKYILNSWDANQYIDFEFDDGSTREINSQYFEIAKAIELGKKVVAVKLDRSYDTPDILYNQGISWAMSFTLESVKTALHKAKYGW